MRTAVSVYKQYIYLVVIIPLLILILTIFISFITYEFVKRDRKFIYFNELANITSTIESNFNYIERFASIIGDKIIKQHEEGKPVGIISAGIDIEKLVNKIKENFNANSISFLLFNDNFDLIAKSNSNAILIDKNLSKELILLYLTLVF